MMGQGKGGPQASAGAGTSPGTSAQMAQLSQMLMQQGQQGAGQGIPGAMPNAGLIPSPTGAMNDQQWSDLQKLLRAIKPLTKVSEEDAKRRALLYSGGEGRDY